MLATGIQIKTVFPKPESSNWFLTSQTMLRTNNPKHKNRIKMLRKRIKVFSLTISIIYYLFFH